MLFQRDENKGKFLVFVWWGSFCLFGLVFVCFLVCLEVFDLVWFFCRLLCSNCWTQECRNSSTSWELFQSTVDADTDLLPSFLQVLQRCIIPILKNTCYHVPFKRLILILLTSSSIVGIDSSLTHRKLLVLGMLYMGEAGGQDKSGLKSKGKQEFWKPQLQEDSACY